MHRVRLVELLANAIICFERCSNPFSHSELLKLDVTADECRDLSREIAEIIENDLCLMIGRKSAESILEKIRKEKQE